MCRLYISIFLADWLLAKDIASVGMLVANQRGLPNEFHQNYQKGATLLQSIMTQGRVLCIVTP